MTSSDDFNTYYWAVAEAATKIGYNIAQVGIFLSDIRNCYEDEKSVNQCLEEIF